MFSFSSFHIINKRPFCGLLSAHLFLFVSLLVVISVFKFAPKYIAEVLASVPPCKISVSDKLHSSMSYGVIGCESSVNAPMIYIM